MRNEPVGFVMINDYFAFFILSAVCTCVVHKRCHLEVVSQCPGVKQEIPEAFPNDEKVF